MNGHTVADTNGHVPSRANGSTNSSTNGTSNGHPNGHTTTDFYVDQQHTHPNGAPNGTNGTHATNNDTTSAAAEVEPIAIIGMSCRLSGDVSSAEELWQLCSRARSGWSKVPNDRWSHEGYYHPNASKTGTYNAEGGHFIQEDVGLFDAPFFNISATEAKSIDPQQRLLLECTYEAFENSGIPKEKVVGKNVGVFVGGSFSDYSLYCLRDLDTSPPYEGTGTAQSVLSNRLSYYFDLKGPSVTVDTACSSTMAALHLACQSVRSGESSQAVVGGSHLNLVPEIFVSMSNLRILSQSGKSHSFDNSASGFGRGEGIGCIVLKPLKAALADGDKIRAVIRNTGMNQDGRTQGLSMPNGSAQAELIRSVYDSAGLDPLDTGYVEAHGTGTKVGDPIETKALHSVFGEGRSTKEPLFIGSIKSNIGHAEGSSGILAVIKTALMLEKGFILPNINFKKPNEAIPLAEWNMKVPKSQLPWPRKKKYASINNFGFGGTNCHVVLEAPPKPSKTDRANLTKPQNGLEGNALVTASKLGVASHKIRFLFMLSAHSEKSVKSQMQSLQMYLEQRPETLELSVMGKLAYTLCQRRSFLPCKVAISATTSSELIHKLSNPDIKPTSSFHTPRIAFVFTGQGAQWHAMGRELMSIYPAYASAVETADNYLQALGAEWSLKDELLKDSEESLVGHAYISQPACTAIQIALVQLLASWGIHAAGVVGHSSGEIAAAFAAGILSVEACLRIAYFRGLATVSFKTKFSDLRGSMMAIGAGPEEIRPLTKTLNSGRAVVACINSPSSITVAGDENAIDELGRIVEEKRIFNRKLRVDMAYHSHHMELVAEEYLASLKDIRPREAVETRFFSSVTGSEISSSELGATYWAKNLTSPVQFGQALRAMCLALNESGSNSSQQGNTILVEVGPHSALEGPVKQTLKATGAAVSGVEYTPSLVRNIDAVESVQQLAAVLSSKGKYLNFEAINFPRGRDRTVSLLTDLPRYPWNHATRYWHQSRIGDNRRFVRQFPRNDILGAMADDSNDLEPRWRNIIRLEDMPWLRDHQIQSNIVFPMAGYVTMAMEAAYQRATMRNVKFDRYEFREISANRALLIEEGQDVETMITLRPYNEGTKKSTDAWDEFRIFAWAVDKGWTEHCRGLVGVQKDKTVNAVDGQRQIDTKKESLKSQRTMMNQSCTEVVDINQLASNLKSLGVYYGPAFQSFVECRTTEQLAVAEVELADTAAMMPQNFEPELIMHPAHLDLVIQILWPLLGAGRKGWDKIYMPSGFKRLSISPNTTKTPGSRLRVYGSSPEISHKIAKPIELDVFATQDSNPEEACVILEGYTITPVHHDTSDLGSSKRNLCYKMDWQPMKPREVQPSLDGMEAEIVIVSEHSSAGLANELKSSLEKLINKVPQVTSFAEVKAENKVYIMLSELDTAFLNIIDMDSFSRVQEIIGSCKGILWASRGAYSNSTSPDSNMALGLARTVRSETGLNFATIDLDSQKDNKGLGTETETAILDAFSAVFGSSSDDPDMEYMEREGILYTPTVVNDDDMNKFVHQQLRESEPELQSFHQDGRPLKMTIGNPGLLDTLHFIDDYSLTGPLGEDRVEIEVKAVGLNFKDVMIAMGHLVNEHIGIECSGVVTQVGSNVTHVKPGDRVCAIAEGSFASYIRCHESTVSIIDDSLTFETASTIPVIWSTAYYSLIHVARLEEGESVLIHAAAGGVGQAAIILAKMVGAKIFVTVGSAEKKEYLKSQYGIPEEHIFFSRDTSFADQVQSATNGRGVDVVLNSLAGDALLATWQCVAPFGRFVEIGKRDIVNNSRLEMAPFVKNITFSSVDLVVVVMERPALMKKILASVFDLYRKGIVRPITPLSVFPVSNVEAGFRSLQSGKNLGKIAITFGADDIVQAVPAKLSDTLLRDDGAYLIIGGTGGLGRSMTRWMARKGARRIILASRSSSVSSAVQTLIDDLSVDGVEVMVRKCDVSKREDVQKLVDETPTVHPIRGVVHSAMVLNDLLFEKMTFEDYDSVIQPKVAGAWNLHKALSLHKLDFFIMLSSAAGTIGNKGQAAYSAANTFMNAFAQYRMRLGLPATSIDLAAVSDVGYLAENADKKDLVMSSIGSGAVSEIELHGLLAAAMTGKMSGSCSNHCITGLDLVPGSAPPYWMADPKFAPIRPEQDAAVKLTSTVSLRDALKQATSLEDAETLVYTGLVDKVCAILMLAKEDVDGRQPIAAYGLDSLVAVEIRNWVTKQTDTNLQVLELLSSGSLISLSQNIVKKSALLSAELRGTKEDGSVD